MEDIDPLEPQRLQALLERAARLSGVEAVGLKIAVELGRKDEALRQAAPLANGGADPLLAAAHAVDARSVEKIDRPVEDRPQSGLGAVRVDIVAIGVGHVAKT